MKIIKKIKRSLIHTPSRTTLKIVRKYFSAGVENGSNRHLVLTTSTAAAGPDRTTDPLGIMNTKSTLLRSRKAPPRKAWSRFDELLATVIYGLNLKGLPIHLFFKEVARGGGEQTRVLSISFIFTFFTTLPLSHSAPHQQ
jgi:hypothetical protein